MLSILNYLILKHSSNQMKRILIALVFCSILASGCKKKICGVISAISIEASPADGQPLYKVYLESGEVVPMRSKGGYEVGEAYCND